MQGKRRQSGGEDSCPPRSNLEWVCCTLMELESLGPSQEWNCSTEEDTVSRPVGEFKKLNIF